MTNNFDIGIDDMCRSVGLTDSKSGLQVGDLVILNPDYAIHLYDGGQLEKDKYKEIHINGIKGKVVSIGICNSHYSFGEYAHIKWENGSESKFIHTGWLEKR